jgi:hypothetical protein
MTYPSQRDVIQKLRVTVTMPTTPETEREQLAVKHSREREDRPCLPESRQFA